MGNFANMVSNRKCCQHFTLSSRMTSNACLGSALKGALRPRGPEAGGVDRAAERPRLASALLLPTRRLLRTGIKKDLLVEVRNFLVH